MGVCFGCTIIKTCVSLVLRHHICTQCDGWKRPLHSSNLAMDWLDCLIGPHGTISHSYWLVKLSNWSTCFVINNLLLFKVALSSLWVELRIYEYVIINPKIWNKPRYLSKKRKFNFNTLLNKIKSHLQTGICPINFQLHQLLFSLLESCINLFRMSSKINIKKLMTK